MNNDVLRAYKTADDVLRMLMIASGYATQAHELTSLAIFGDDPQDMERNVLQTRARLAQRLVDLNSLDSDIRSASERLGDHWQRLQAIREFAYSDAGPYVIGELLTAVIPFVRRWIRETCSWLELGKKFPVHLPPESGLVCNATADGVPLSIETMQVFHDRLLRERSILLKNIAGTDGNERPDELPDDTIRTIAGDVVLRNELTEEDRPSGEWALICGFTDDTFRNRMTKKAKGPTWRIVESSSQRYRVHVEDLPQKIRGSKKQRDEFLKVSKD